jgi:hypothetical protein
MYNGAATPFRRSSFIVQRRRVFSSFVAVKQRSALHDVSDNVVAIFSSFRTSTNRLQTVISKSSIDSEVRDVATFKAVSQCLLYQLVGVRWQLLQLDLLGSLYGCSG